MDERRQDNGTSVLGCSWIDPGARILYYKSWWEHDLCKPSTRWAIFCFRCGHSSWEEAALTAREGEVKCLFLIHHDPDRVDKDVADILYKAQKVFSDTELATEGSVYDFEGDRLLE